MQTDQVSIRRCFRDLAYRDDVTGLYNQRKLHKDLDESVRNFHDYDSRFYVFFLDIDHFKDINDNYGHLMGTKILLRIAELLKDVLRENDLVYRYGGDEFVIIIPDVDHELALGIGRRILVALEGQRFGIANFRLSVSIGRRDSRMMQRRRRRFWISPIG